DFFLEHFIELLVFAQMHITGSSGVVKITQFMNLIGKEVILTGDQMFGKAANTMKRFTPQQQISPRQKSYVGIRYRVAESRSNLFQNRSVLGTFLHRTDE